MFKEILVRRLSTGTIFKLAAIVVGTTMFPLILLVGIFSIFGAEIVTVNGYYVTGPFGFLVALLIGLIVMFVQIGFLGLFMVIGLWIFSKIKPITLGVYI